PDRSSTGTGARISALPQLHSSVVSRSSGMVVHLLLHRGSGRALLPRLDAEPPGAPSRKTLGATDNRGSLRVIALQQARGSLQLAIRPARRYGRHLLRTRMASATTRGSVRNHPRHGRYALVALA